MEIQLQELIEQIKKDGVAVAEAKAKAIIDAAKTQAENIITDAHMHADKILADAKTASEHMVKSSEDAIRQAGRNLLISFRESVARELKAVIGENVAAVYSSESLKELIIKIVENRAGRPDAEDMTLILNEKDMHALEELLLAGLKDRMLKGVVLKANDNFNGGFRIAANNGSAYYDYSAEAVVDMLSNYLSPRITELMKKE